MGFCISVLSIIKHFLLHVHDALIDKINMQSILLQKIGTQPTQWTQTTKAIKFCVRETDILIASAERNAYKEQAQIGSFYQAKYYSGNTFRKASQFTVKPKTVHYIIIMFIVVPPCVKILVDISSAEQTPILNITQQSFFKKMAKTEIIFLNM